MKTKLLFIYLGVVICALSSLLQGVDTRVVALVLLLMVGVVGIVATSILTARIYDLLKRGLNIDTVNIRGGITFHEKKESKN